MLDIKFPVFPIKRHQRIIKGEEGPVLIIGIMNTVHVLDDRSLKGEFGARRLHLKAALKGQDFKYYYLRKSLKGWAELTHHVRKDKVRKYVDSTGYIFKYEPTTFYPLTYHKILKRINTEGKGWHIEVSGIHTPLKISYIPTENMVYAGLIKLPTGFIVYELSSHKKPNTRRKL